MKYEYVWDEQKRQDNIRKHNLDFVRAAEVFNDPNGLLYYQEHEDEDRYLFIGLLDNIVVTLIVFTEKDFVAVRRIISFRKATKEERRLYYGEQ